MVQKAQLLALVEQGQVEILRFAGTLTEEERTQSGSPEKWAARDILSHLAFWKLHTAEKIAALRGGGDQKSESGYQQINETVFEKFRSADWQTIAGLLERSHRALVEQVNLLSEAEINSAGYVADQDKAPVWRKIAGDSFIHPMSHLGPAYLERGERAYCDEMRMREEVLVSAIDPSPEWQATNQYNLACHWALSGENEKALDLLAIALRNRPDLIDWSTQDTDLVSLHGTPAFLALLENVRKEQKTR